MDSREKANGAIDHFSIPLTLTARTEKREIAAMGDGACMSKFSDLFDFDGIKWSA